MLPSDPFEAIHRGISGRVALALGLAVAAIGLTALLGWVFRLPWGPGVDHVQVPMAPVTAALFVCLGLLTALGTGSEAGPGRVRGVVGAAAATIGTALILLFLRLQGVYWKAEHLGLDISGDAGGVPLGYISPVTALCFVLAGISLPAALPMNPPRRRLTLPATGAAGLLLGTNFVLLLAYLYGTPLLYGGSLIPPALSTVTGFVLLGGALLAAAVRAQGPRGGTGRDASFGSQALFLAFALSVAGIVTVGFLSFWSYQARFREEVERQLDAVADLKVIELAQWRQERISDGRVFFNHPDFARLVQQRLEPSSDSGLRNRLAEWLGQVQKAYDYERVYLVDADGRELAGVPAEGAGNPEFYLSPGVAEARDVTILDFHRDHPEDPVHLSVAVPILDPTDQTRRLGTLIFRTDPARHLFPLIRRWPTRSTTAEALIVRREGDEVVILSELRLQADAPLNLRLPISDQAVVSARASLEHQGIVEAVDYRGVPVVAALRAVPDSPWFLVAQMDTEEVYRPIRERLWLTVALGATLLLGSGLGLGMAWRQQRINFYRRHYEAAEALRRSEEQFRAMFDLAPVGIAQADPQTGRWCRVNRRMSQITGYTEDELLQLGFSDVTHPDDRARDWDAFQGIIRGDAPDYRLEKRYLRKDGSLAWVNVNVTVLRDPAGKPYRTMAAVEDVTVRKQSEAAIHQLNQTLEQRVRERTQQLEAANRELEAFSYSVSHDLRSPLRAIDGFARILSEDHEGSLDGEGRRLLDVICAEARRMGRLIDDLLAFSRVGRSAFRSAEVDMESLARTAFEDCSRPFPDRNLEFAVGPLPPAWGDPAMLRQVLANLIQNAIKYTQPREFARIEVGGRLEDGDTVYWVRDNGIGFDMKYAGKLFGVFQRLHGEDEFEGTGVGLALVKRVIDRHSGRVWAEAAPGEGACFWFAVPAGREV